MEQTTGFEDMMDKDYRQGYPYTVPLMVSYMNIVTIDKLST